MEMISALPEWLVWCAGCGVGASALAVLANTIDPALDLEP